MVVQKNKAAPIDVARLRPYLVHPVEVAWAVLPISLKKSVGTIEKLSLYKTMFGPRAGDETTDGETTEPEEPETTDPETTEPVVTEPVTDEVVYVPSQPEPPEIIFTEPLTTEPETTEEESTDE